MSLNYNYIRELNKFTIQLVPKTGNVSTIFKAYLSNGFRFDLSVDYGSMLGSTSLVGNQYINMALQYFGKTSTVDMPKKNYFTGGRQVSFTVSTFLVLKDSYENDIRKPLQNVINFFLPKQGTDIVDWLGLEEGISREIGKSKGFVQDFWNLAQKGIELLKDYAGPFYTVEVPDMLNITDGSKLKIFFGNNYSISEVFIKGIGVDYPQFTYDTGYPAFVRVTFNIETLRIASTQSISGLI